MKKMGRFCALFALALLIGFGAYAMLPSDAGAYTCGFGCYARIACYGQGECDPGLYQYGIISYSPPGQCTSVCHFEFQACLEIWDC